MTTPAPDRQPEGGWRHVLQNGVASYVLALTIIATLSIATHVLLDMVIRSQENAASVVNVAGRQRMLSQRIARLALELSVSRHDSAPELERLLESSISLMETSHQALLHDSVQLGVFPRRTEAIVDIYYEAPLRLDAQVTAFVMTARQFLTLPALDRTASAELRELLTQARQPLLASLDAAVKQYELDSQADIIRLRWYMGALLLVMLATLVLEARFIFRPLFLRLRRAHDQLLDAVIESDRSRHAAEQASRAKGNFLRTISHELRTPMNGMLGMAYLLKESGELSAENREYVTALENSGQALLATVSGILELSALEAHELVLDEVNFNLIDVLTVSSNTFKIAAAAKGLGLSVQVGIDVPHLLTGDPLRLRQMLCQLIGNAVKFTSSGEVGVCVRLDERTMNRARLTFEIRDTGIGIATEHQEKIFAAFVQEDSSYTRRFSGSGVGLSICRHLVELMGGEIHVRSEPGHGSTFTVTASFGIGLASTEVSVDRTGPRELADTLQAQLP